MYNAKQSMAAEASGAEELTRPEMFLDETLVGSDCLLPAQLYGAGRGHAAMGPLKRLMRAVLVDAIHCYQRNFDALTIRKQREFREAQNWLFKDSSDGPFSFDTVCYVLDIHPDFLRQRLIQFQYARVRECRTRPARSPSYL
jgi:hypothetical protein